LLEDREARELGLTVSLSHLVDARLELVNALRNATFAAIPGGKISQVKDVAALKAADWLTALQGAKIPPPSGIDQQTYAAQLSKRAADLFPTDAFVTRALPKTTQNVAPALNQLKPLLDKNPVTFGLPFTSLKTDGLPPQNLVAMRAAHAQLQRLVNILPGMRLNDILNAKTPSAQKAQLLAQRLELVTRVYQLNPEVEFLTLDYAPDSPDVAALNLTGLTPDEQRLVIATFKAYQRALAITNDVDHAQAVLEAGYHSAAAIAAGTLDAFQTNTGPPEPVARMYYQTARSTVAAVTTAAVAMADTLRGGFEQLNV